MSAQDDVGNHAAMTRPSYRSTSPANRLAAATGRHPVKMVAVLSLVVASGCATGPPCARPYAGTSRAMQWSQIATDYGEVAIPVGWHVRAVEFPEPMFDINARDPDLAGFTLPVRKRDTERTMQVSVQRQLRDLHAPAGFALEEQADGSSYGAQATRPGRVFAGCAVPYEGGGDVAVLAVTLMDDDVAVSRAHYDASGGRDMLCGIAASVRRLRLASP